MYRRGAEIGRNTEVLSISNSDLHHLGSMGFGYMGEKQGHTLVKPPRGWNICHSYDGRFLKDRSHLIRGVVQGGQLHPTRPYSRARVKDPVTNPFVQDAYNRFQQELSGLAGVTPLDLGHVVEDNIAKKAYSSVCSKLATDLGGKYEGELGDLLEKYLRGVSGAIRSGKINPRQNFERQVKNYDFPRLKNSDKYSSSDIAAIRSVIQEILDNELQAIDTHNENGIIVYECEQQLPYDSILSTYICFSGNFTGNGQGLINDQNFLITLSANGTSPRGQKQLLNRINSSLRKNMKGRADFSIK